MRPDPTPQLSLDFSRPATDAGLEAGLHQPPALSTTPETWSAAGGFHLLMTDWFRAASPADALPPRVRRQRSARANPRGTP